MPARSRASAGRSSAAVSRMQRATGATLSRDEAASAFDSMMSGEATPSQMGGLLMALRVRGETTDEIAGAVKAMRDKMLRVDAPAGPTCRRGGSELER